MIKAEKKAREDMQLQQQGIMDWSLGNGQKDTGSQKTITKRMKAMDISSKEEEEL